MDAVTAQPARDKVDKIEIAVAAYGRKGDQPVEKVARSPEHRWSLFRHGLAPAQTGCRAATQGQAREGVAGRAFRDSVWAIVAGKNLSRNKNQSEPTGRFRMPERAKPVLDVRGLKTVFRTRAGDVHAVNDVSFSVAPASFGCRR